jgi:hypothetical protein
MMGIGQQMAGAATGRRSVDHTHYAPGYEDDHAQLCKKLLSPAKGANDAGWSTTVCSAVYHSDAVQAALTKEFARFHPMAGHSRDKDAPEVAGPLIGDGGAPLDEKARAKLAKRKKQAVAAAKKAEADEGDFGRKPDGLLVPVVSLALFLLIGFYAYTDLLDEGTSSDAESSSL